MEQKINPIALANTFGLIDLVLHPLFHLWTSLAPRSYEYLMNLFVSGLHFEVTHFDSDLSHIIISTIIEASVFWVLGFVGATVYNFFVGKSKS
jgi:hypothetical protein